MDNYGKKILLRMNKYDDKFLLQIIVFVFGCKS